MKQGRILIALGLLFGVGTVPASAQDVEPRSRVKALGRSRKRAMTAGQHKDLLTPS
jgi:hypothetical protein